MFGINLQATYLRKIITFLITIVLISGLVSCSDRLPELSEISSKKSITTSTAAKISEISPPEIIQKLRQALDIYKPKIKIQNPLPDRIFQDNTINVELQVEDLPIFKSDLELGPYLEVILDDRHYTKVYDLSQPILLYDLEPGTHTLRVFACSPWDESFKNQDAYAQTTFHIFTKTASNNPASNLPLLTYNSPLGSYGAEPILLDYYLTNPPLNSVDSDDEMVDWRVRVTVNGKSFTTDQWQPIYLQGFNPGKNWVKLEYIDELGNSINNVYNNTARLISYQPGGTDTLSKIIRGEILLKEAFSIVDPEYIYEEPQLDIIPELEEIPNPESTNPEDLTVEESLMESDNPEDLTVESEVLPNVKIGQEIESQSQPTESEKSQTLKEKTNRLMNWAKSRFNSINKVGEKQEKQGEKTTLNTAKESENIDSFQYNESLTLPEIVEEAPIPQPAAENLPQETSNLTPNIQEITNSETDYALPEDEYSQQENTVELEEIKEEKSNIIDDSPEDFTEEIENENAADAVENITE